MAGAKAIDGVLLFDKPTGPSSNQALQRVKRLFGAAKAGHAGTLDPFAVGLLPILFGEATKFASYLSDAGKAYCARIVLGKRTSTGDTTGELIEERRVEVSPQRIEAALKQFRGRVSQIPPMFSALKHGGQPLYRLARRGEEVSRLPREIEIHRLDVVDLRGNVLEVLVECSKGTYVRVLAEDLGESLGCGGALDALRRIRIGEFTVDRAYSLQALEAMTPDARAQTLLPVDAALVHLPMCLLAEEETQRIRWGQRVEAQPTLAQEGAVRLYRQCSGEFLGLGAAENGWLRAQRLLSSD